MSHNSSKKVKQEEFQTAFSKSDWYGTGKRRKNKKKPVKNKSYKKIVKNLDAVEGQDSYTQNAHKDEIRAVSSGLNGIVDAKHNNSAA